MFISPAFAQAAGDVASGPGILEAILPWVFILVIFYFLLIRPQQKRFKDHQAMVAAVEKGAVVVTQGGLIGKVTKVEEAEVEIEIAAGVKVRVVKSTLSDIRK